MGGGVECPTSALTGMKPLVWERTLLESGFAAAYPRETTRILRGILDGVPVDFLGDRKAPRFGPNLPVQPVDVAKISAVVEADVLALKKAGPFDVPPLPDFVVSPIGCVPKKVPGKIRVIHHLSYPFKGDSVNASVLAEALELSSFGTAAQAIVAAGRGCFLIKLDVEAAYKQVPVRREDWHLLGFKWLGKYYFERVLPFGLRSSCRLWDLYASALHFLFEWLGVSVVIHYIDDFLFVVQCERSARALLVRALSLCVELGIPMAPDKTEGPTTCLTFLGIEVDTQAMRARLPQAKLLELQQLTADWVERSIAGVKDLESLAGMLDFACAVVRPGRFYMRRLWNHIARAKALTKRRDARLPLSKAAMADIEWWQQFIASWNGSSSCSSRSGRWPTCSISPPTPARTAGAPSAATSGSRRAGRLSSASGHAQGQGVHALLRALCASGGGCHLGSPLERQEGAIPLRLLGCRQEHPGPDESQPAFDASTSDSSLMEAARHQFDFQCQHIDGVANVAADLLSRHGRAALFMPDFQLACPNAVCKPLPVIKLLLPQPQDE